MILAAAAVVAAAALGMIAASPASASGPGGYELKSNFFANKCAAPSATANDSPVINTTCRADLAGPWRALVNGPVVLEDQRSHRCMDTREGRLDAGTVVVIGTCTGSATQTWVSGYYDSWPNETRWYLRNSATNGANAMCLTAYDGVSGGKYYNYIFPCPNGTIAANQLWTQPIAKNWGP